MLKIISEHLAIRQMHGKFVLENMLLKSIMAGLVPANSVGWKKRSVSTGSYGIPQRRIQCKLNNIAPGDGADYANHQLNQGKTMPRVQLYPLAITVALMAGCATSPVGSQQVVPISTIDLCYRVIKYPSSHLYYETWLNELKKRGEDCSMVREQITQQVKTEKEAERLRSEEYERHQRQLELEAAKAPKTIIKQSPPVYIPGPTHSNCRPDGWGGFYCDTY